MNVLNLNPSIGDAIVSSIESTTGHLVEIVLLVFPATHEPGGGVSVDAPEIITSVERVSMEALLRKVVEGFDTATLVTEVRNA